MYRDNLGTGPRPVSIVISSQVTNVASVVPDGDFVTLNFQYSTVSLIEYQQLFIYQLILIHIG